MMRHARTLLVCGLGRTQLHPAIDGHRVATHNLAAKSLRQFERKRRLSAPRRPQQNHEQRQLILVSFSPIHCPRPAFLVPRSLGLLVPAFKTSTTPAEKSTSDSCASTTTNNSPPLALASPTPGCAGRCASVPRAQPSRPAARRTA